MARLDKKRVIESALALLDEVGMEGLTTRKLAQKLNIEQPSLYWHVKSKRALLDGLSVEILLRHHDHFQPQKGEYWADFLRENAKSFRRALLSHRDAAKIHLGTRPSPEQFETVEAQLAFLCEQGFSLEEALYTLGVVSHFTLGSVLEEREYLEAMRDDDPAIHAAMPPLLTKALEIMEQDTGEKPFLFGLEVIILGLEAKQKQKKGNQE